MNYLKDYYIRNLKYELINKFNYSNVTKLPKLKKIILNFGCKTNNIKVLATNLLALELISNKKGYLSTAKHSNLTLRIKEGNPTGCSVRLSKEYQMIFVSKFIVETITKIKNFEGLILGNEKNTLSFTIKNSFNFTSLEDHYHLFNNLSNLNITMITDSYTKEENAFLFKSLQIPFKNL